MPDYDLVVLTSVIDQRAHTVTDIELSSSHAMRAGRYTALCGHLIAPAPLVEPDGVRCPRCAELDRDRRPVGSPFESPGRRRHGLRRPRD